MKQFDDLTDFFGEEIKMPTEAEFRKDAVELAELFMLGVVMQTTINPDFDVAGSIADLIIASYKDGAEHGPFTTE